MGNGCNRIMLTESDSKYKAKSSATICKGDMGGMMMIGRALTGGH